MTQRNIKFRGNSVVAVARDASGITFGFRTVKPSPDGEGVVTVDVLEPVTFSYDRASAANRAEAEGYGWEVRLTRQAAFGRDSNGKPVPVSQKRDAIAELAAFYESGTDSWTMASAGGSLSAETRDLILAVQRAWSADAEAAEDAVRELSAGDRDQLREEPDVRRELDAIRAQRAQSAGPAGSAKAKFLEKLKKA